LKKEERAATGNSTKMWEQGHAQEEEPREKASRGGGVGGQSPTQTSAAKNLFLGGGDFWGRNQANNMETVEELRPH